MPAREYAAGANEGVFIEHDGKKVYSIQSHSIEETNSSRLQHEYGSEEAVGQTKGARTHTITIESAIVVDDAGDDVVPLYLLLRQPGTEIVRYIGQWKTVFTGLKFNSYRESGNLESMSESITLTATKRQDFFKGKPVALDTALTALGR
jgi:hypothetical protein